MQCVIWQGINIQLTSCTDTGWCYVFSVTVAGVGMAALWSQGSRLSVYIRRQLSLILRALGHNGMSLVDITKQF